YGPSSPVVAAAQHNLAYLYQNAGRLAEAEPLYQKALAIRDVPGGNQRDLAGLLTDLGTLRLRQGRNAEAAELIERGLKIRERLLPRDHPEMAASLSAVGTYYLAVGRNAEAETALRRAVEIYSLDSGDIPVNHRFHADLLARLATVYRAEGKIAEAPEAEAGAAMLRTRR